MEMEKLTITFVVLAATWGGMFNLMKIVEMKNGIRDRILGIDPNGQGLSVENRKLLLYSDYVPLAIGIFAFLSLFSSCLASIPSTIPNLNAWDKFACYGAAGFAAFALIVDFVCSIFEVQKMRTHIAGLQ